MFRRTMTKNTSIMTIAVIAAIIIAGTLSVTTTTGQVFAASSSTGSGGSGTSGASGASVVNGEGLGHGAHDPCDNAGPAEHNPHCQ